MKLVALGTGTAIPTEGRNGSAYACLAEDGSSLLVECGPGSTRLWPRHGLSFASVSAIAVTHHHVDHCVDLAAVLFGRNVAFAPKRSATERPQLTLLGPVGHRAHLARLDALYGADIAQPAGSLAVCELADGETFTHGAFEIEAREVRHSYPRSIGLRIRSGGRLLAFSGDSGPCEALVDLCRDADVAMLECSFPSSRTSDNHLNTATAAAAARSAGVRRLVLTHFYPETDGIDVAAEVRDAGFLGELHLATDGFSLLV